MKNSYIVLIVVLLLTGFGLTVRFANDRIAARLEQCVLEYPLPPDTVLVDSESVADKVSGNGNGMHYFGGILVGSDLSEEELYAHYEACADGIKGYAFVEVVPQETQLLFEYHDYRFDHWQNVQPNYRVGIWVCSVAGAEDSIWEALLNTDIRGH